MENKEMVLYRTSDIYFTSFLMGIGMSLIDLEDGVNDRGQPKKIFVVKVPKNDIKHLRKQFFGGIATVKCRQFVDNLKSLKSMLHT